LRPFLIRKRQFCHVYNTPSQVAVAGRETALDAIRRLTVVKGLKSEKKKDIYTWLDTHLKENPVAEGEASSELEK